MTVYTADHRTIASCACVHRRLKAALEMLDEAKGKSREAATVLDAANPGVEQDRDAACAAVALLNRAGQLRAAATEEVRAALHAIENPPPRAGTETLRPASEPESPTTPAA